MECVYNYMYMYVYTLYKSRAYRAAEGGERACIVNSPHVDGEILHVTKNNTSCLLYTSPSPRDATLSRMPSSA